jgi:hypothetical protein
MSRASAKLSFRKGMLKVMDVVRSVPGRLDMRQYAVTIRVRTWGGSRPGVDASTSTDVDSQFGVDAGTFNCRVRQLTQRELIASAGNYSDQDLKVGPLTPRYQGGDANKTAISFLDPPVMTSPTEVFFKITGPGMAAGGSWFKKIGQDVTPNLTYTFTVRRNGETP